MTDLETRLLALAEEWWPLRENGINGWDDLARTLLRDAARIGAEAEREACAVIVESNHERAGLSEFGLADAIRARGEKL